MTSMPLQQQRQLRAVAMTLLTVKPPVYVTSGGVMAARDYKAKCALVNRFARGGVLTSPVHAAIAQLASMHGIDLKSVAQGAEGAPLAGEASAPGAAINFGGQAQPCTPPVPVGNTGTTSTGQGV